MSLNLDRIRRSVLYINIVMRGYATGMVKKLFSSKGLVGRRLLWQIRLLLNLKSGLV